MTDLPPAPPGATRIDFSTGISPVLVGTYALSGALAALCLLGLVRPEMIQGDDADTLAVARVVLGGGLLLFGAVALGGIFVVRNLRRPAGLLVDHEGVDWWQGHDRVRLAAWDEVGAAAVSSKRRPSPLTPGAYAANAMIGAQGWALELWTADRALDGRSRRLLRVPADPAPAPAPAPAGSLPPVRYRLFLAPSEQVARDVAAAVAERAPHVWAGVLERPWNPLAGT